jgi:hypothetical protein
MLWKLPLISSTLARVFRGLRQIEINFNFFKVVNINFLNFEPGQGGQILTVPASIDWKQMLVRTL